MTIRKIINGEDIENTLDIILNKIHTYGPIDLSDFEKMAYIKRFHSNFFKKYESRILYMLGLFYKTSNPSNILEEIYNGISEEINSSIGIKFTPIQASAFKNIKEKKYFSFSAPTSAGKSFLFRELILHTDGDIIIIVPSRALISEYMITVLDIVKDDKSILVLPFIENVNKLKVKRRIFIITPERGVDLFKQINQLNIKLFLFDEAQISEEYIRGMTFDSFVRRVDKKIPDAKKVFTHPFINNPEAQLLKHGFNNDYNYKCYNYNSVGKIYLSFIDGNFKFFSPFTNEKQIITNENIPLNILLGGGTLLIYVSKNSIYEGKHLNEFSEYIDKCSKITNADSIKIIEKLKDFIGATGDKGGKQSYMIEMMEKGIVIHHGSMPLYARILVEEFVNKGYCKICFATSTLLQGINMPFDLVWIDNFKFHGSEFEKIINLKNLIGRAGRTTSEKNKFDFGYVVVNNRNVVKFSSRINLNALLENSSNLDNESDNLNDDLKDLVEAIKEDSFDDNLKLTNSQVQRLKEANIKDNINFILENFLINGKTLTSKQYYELSPTNRKKLKESFKRIFLSHLRRDSLTISEQSILSASIPILLWQIQGKSFKEIVGLRYAYLTQKDERLKIDKKIKDGEITEEEGLNEKLKIELKFSPIASTIPDIQVGAPSLFGKKSTIKELDYDILVYDTYDYIDKVIGLSLSLPLSGAFLLYYEQTKDKRALSISNYIRYGTDDEQEILLLRYGFTFEEIEWIKPCISLINEDEIKFNFRVYTLSSEQKKVIERFK
ncbi:MAG: DEAD/DEAH box helicase [Candidatus Gracilibacteria bacterium]|nr:DEAD/DEAH box helicase [Candidatus Gracilibacteria bacterium]